jgi:hypothetical protein
VYLKFDQGSELYGSSIRIPIACKFQAGLPGISPVSSSDDDEDDDDDITLERIGGGDNDDQDYSDNYDSVSNEREVKLLPKKFFSFNYCVKQRFPTFFRSCASNQKE